jgi:4-amino-4-deoxy-L-arabinose transferase-like glycosyltransferase
LSGAIIFASTLFVFLAFLSAAPPTTNKETRVWKVVTSMSDSGDLLVPRIDGQPHLTKPPLYYWLAILAGKVAGETSLLTLRIPSVVAALALALVAFSYGSRAAGPFASMACAVFLVTMARFPDWGRTGAFDMLLAFFCGIALVSFYLAVSVGRFGFFPVFCVATGLAFLTKGTPVLLTVVIPCALWLFVDGRLSVLRRPSTYFWVAAGILVGLSWYMALLLQFPESRDVFLAQILLPLGEETQQATATHYAPFYYYLLRIWEITFPACLFIPPVVRRAVKSRFWRANPFCRFNALTFCVMVVLFSAIPGKQAHYILPAFLPLAALVAESVTSGLESADGFTASGVRALLVFVSALLVLVIPVFVFFEWTLVGRSAFFVSAVSAAGAVLAILVLVTAVKRRWVVAMLLFLLSMASIQAFFVDEFLVWQSQFRTGTVASRTDYDGLRWETNFKRYPLLARFFREDPMHRVDGNGPSHQ